MSEERVEARRERSGRRAEPAARRAGGHGHARRRAEAADHDADDEVTARNERVGTRAVETDSDVDGPREPYNRMSAGDAARAGVAGLSEVIKSPPVGVTAVSPRHDGWMVSVEVVELERLPSSASLMALYEAELDKQGTLRSYRRVSRYTRGRGEGEDRR